MTALVYVQSHVARDLLQSATFFANEKVVVWEYVSNGLEYIDENTNPVVYVVVNNKNKRITIEDNGRGMTWAGLDNFFIMHGENIDRKKGKPGRGRFGTGKSAAFGIADVLRITTVRNGRRSKVLLTREEILKLDSGAPIPVVPLEREKPTHRPNGTLVEIENIHLKSIDQSGIIKYIEHHLARWPNATVYVNNHLCEFQEPPVWDERKYRAEGTVNNRLGDVELIIKIAKGAVDEDIRGISIFSNGIWHEKTMAGSENKEMSQFIFGEIDVPALDADRSPISPFYSSRSMQLNPSNELVQILYSFISQKVEEVRKELVKVDRHRKESEDIKRLERHAAEIEQLINEDFHDFKDKVIRLTAKGGHGFDLGPSLQGDGAPDDTAFGDEVPAEVVDPAGSASATDEASREGTKPRTMNPEVVLVEGAERKLGRLAGGERGSSARRGGFRVEFSNNTAEESRAKYDTATRTIFINLDHPQLTAARTGQSVEDPFFRKLTYEIAFTEYAVALAHELDRNNRIVDISDAIFEIRQAMDRIARRGASIFSST